jgi:hypothetical protein
MDPHDRLRARLERTSCTVCGDALAIREVRLLAERDGLAFVELPCRGCGAVTLGMISLPEGRGSMALDTEPGPPTWIGPADLPPRPGAAPLGRDDVLAMRRFLAEWRGDLRELLADPAVDGGTEGAGP